MSVALGTVPSSTYCQRQAPTVFSVAHIGADDAFYGVTPDGQRFLIGKRTTPSEKESGLRVILNGLAALKESGTR